MTEYIYNNTYMLYHGNKIIKKDCLLLVMNELMQIIKENGNPISVTSDKEDTGSLVFEFEGKYCDFKIKFKRVLPTI